MCPPWISDLLHAIEIYDIDTRKFSSKKPLWYYMALLYLQPFNRRNDMSVCTSIAQGSPKEYGNPYLDSAQLRQCSHVATIIVLQYFTIKNPHQK